VQWLGVVVTVNGAAAQVRRCLIAACGAVTDSGPAMHGMRAVLYGTSKSKVDEREAQLWPVSLAQLNGRIASSLPPCPSGEPLVDACSRAA